MCNHELRQIECGSFLGRTDTSRMEISLTVVVGYIPSIDLVRSFPPDSMHLFWENVLPDPIKHWRGRFNTLNTFEAATTAGSGKKRGAPDIAPGQPARKKRAVQEISTTHGTRRSDKFQATDDPWNVLRAQWDALGRDMVDSKSTIPLHFGEASRDFWEHCHHLKAAEWRNTCLIFYRSI
jgi:hypothetical protein